MLGQRARLSTQSQTAEHLLPLSNSTLPSETASFLSYEIGLIIRITWLVTGYKVYTSGWVKVVHVNHKTTKPVFTIYFYKATS